MDFAGSPGKGSPSQVLGDGQGYGALLSTWVLLTLPEEKENLMSFGKCLPCNTYVHVYDEEAFSGTLCPLTFT